MANSNYKILILDEDIGVLDSFCKTLDKSGFKFLKVTSSREALDLLVENNQNIILIISGLSVPDDELKFRKKSLDLYKNIPFALLSGLKDLESIISNKSNKICGFIDRSFGEKKILDFISKSCVNIIESIDEDLELILDFMDDAKPLIEEIENDILRIEETKGDLESINNMMRLLHTIKGTAACVGLNAPSKVAHRFEDLVVEIKTGEYSVDESLINVFLKGFDLLKKTILNSIERVELTDIQLKESLSLFDISLKNNSEKSQDQNLSKTKKNDFDEKAQGLSVLKLDKKEEVNVSVDILDEFMELSGELTVSRNASNKILQKIINKLGMSEEFENLNEVLSEIHKICGKMQSLVVETRKVSLKQVFKSIPRVVRDLSKTTGKKVNLNFIGDDLRVDNVIAKVLTNSLVHMVRNSLDHGLECPDERLQSGKIEIGNLSLESIDLGEDIVVNLVDDGRGINRENILSRLRKKEMFLEDEIQKMSDKRILSMIFEPGFSTAEVITDVSGRGVGMDMVKTSITDINGQIEIESEPQKGTKISLIMPKPKAVLIIASLFVKICGEKFAIPQSEISRILQLEGEKLKQIQSIKEKRYLVLEEELFPIVEISDLLNLKSETYVEDQKNIKILVLKSERLYFAIEVDEILDMEEVVIKKLSGYLSKEKIFLGVTYAEDSELCMALNTEGIVESIEGVCEVKDESEAKDIVLDEEMAKSDFLLVDLDMKGQFAIPLNHIYRLEQFRRSDLQMIGKQNIIKYDNEFLSIKFLKTLLQLNKINKKTGEEKTHPEDIISVVVFKMKGSYKGFVVNKILDVFKTSAEVDTSLVDRDGLLGSFELEGKTVTLVDIFMFLDDLRIEKTTKIESGILTA